MSREKLTIKVTHMVLAGIFTVMSFWQLFKGELAIALACGAIARIHLLELEIMEKKKE